MDAHNSQCTPPRQVSFFRAKHAVFWGKHQKWCSHKSSFEAQVDAVVVTRKFLIAHPEACRLPIAGDGQMKPHARKNQHVHGSEDGRMLRVFFLRRCEEEADEFPGYRAALAKFARAKIE
jgi:hypothetical protein